MIFSSLLTTTLSILASAATITTANTQIPFGEEGLDHFAQLYPSRDAGEIINDANAFPQPGLQEHFDYEEKAITGTAPVSAANCSSIFFLGGQKVPWTGAAAACEAWGMVLADINIANFNASIASQFLGGSGYSTAWINSWDGNSYNTCLSQNTGVDNCGGAITVPASCTTPLNVLCVDPNYTPSCNATSWCLR